MFNSNHNIHAANKEMREMIHEAEQLLNEAKATTGEKAAELHKKGVDLLSCSIAKAHELERQTVNSVYAIAASTDRMVQAHPWRSTAISGLVGAGVGLLLGMAIARD